MFENVERGQYIEGTVGKLKVLRIGLGQIGDSPAAAKLQRLLRAVGPLYGSEFRQH